MKVRTCEELQDMVQDGAKIIDVREPMELVMGKLHCSVNVPMALLTQVSEMFEPEDKLLVYCHTGRRSEHAANMLKSMGYENTENIGGIVHYTECTSPIC